MQAGATRVDGRDTIDRERDGRAIRGLVCPDVARRVAVDDLVTTCAEDGIGGRRYHAVTERWLSGVTPESQYGARSHADARSWSAGPAAAAPGATMAIAVTKPSHGRDRGDSDNGDADNAKVNLARSRPDPRGQPTGRARPTLLMPDAREPQPAESVEAEQQRST